MPERVILSIAPEKYQPSAKAGMARCPQSLNQNIAHVDGALQTKALEPLPSTGNQPSSMPKTMIRTSPTKKPGMESPSNATASPRAAPCSALRDRSSPPSSCVLVDVGEEPLARRLR